MPAPSRLLLGGHANLMTVCPGQGKAGKGSAIKSWICGLRDDSLRSANLQVLFHSRVAECLCSAPPQITSTFINTEVGGKGFIEQMQVEGLDCKHCSFCFLPHSSTATQADCDSRLSWPLSHPPSRNQKHQCYPLSSCLRFAALDVAAYVQPGITCAPATCSDCSHVCASRPRALPRGFQTEYRRKFSQQHGSRLSTQSSHPSLPGRGVHSAPTYESPAPPG